MQKLKYVLASSLIAAVIPMASFVSAQSQDYIVPRTPDGQPDLQGLWTNDTITPMERPASLQGRAFLTEDEITAMEKNLAEQRTFADDNIEVTVGGNIGGYNQVWLDSGDTVLSTGQTSLIVDPPMAGHHYESRQLLFVITISHMLKMIMFIARYGTAASHEEYRGQCFLPGITMLTDSSKQQTRSR